MNLESRARRIDGLLAHVWMVRTFVKHSDEAAEVDELTEVFRDLYDFSLALGPAIRDQNWEQYLKIAAKKLGRLRRATETFCELQPDISQHMNFVMAAQSLRVAVNDIAELIGADTRTVAPNESSEN